MVLVAIVLLSGVLFSVKSFTCDIKGDSRLLIKTDINKQLTKYVGSNIFFLDEKEITAELEDKFPHIAIINIERIFPSNAVVHCYERKEIFALDLYDGSYAKIDNEGKVLGIEQGNITAATNLVQLKSNKGDITFNGVGYYLNGKIIENALNVYNSFASLDVKGFSFNSFVKSVAVADLDVKLTLNSGGEMLIADALLDTNAKVSLGYAFYNSKTPSERVNLRIKIIFDATEDKNIVIKY